MHDTHLTETEITALENLVGKKIVDTYGLATRGGYTTAVRKIVACEDGFRYFAKVAREEHVASWMATEARVYQQLRGLDLPFAADFLVTSSWVRARLACYCRISAVCNGSMSGQQGDSKPFCRCSIEWLP